MKRKINTELISRSHIHDAINLFNLVKIELQELDSTEDINKQIKKIKKLVDSSVNHFKEVFETLDHKNSELYHKSTIDLKDLIDLEIFDAFKDSKLIIEDNVKQNNALINGNFPLVSKALLNLIENSLKISKSTIKVSLEDDLNYWSIKIHTPDQAFKEHLAKSLEELNPISSRHGLKSVTEIIKYHEAKIEIINIYNSENCIAVKFPKLQTINLHNRKAIHKFNTSKISLKKFKMLSAILLFLLTILSIQKINHFNYDNKISKLTNYSNSKLASKKSELNLKLNKFKINPEAKLITNEHFMNLTKIEKLTLIYQSYLKTDILSKAELNLIQNYGKNFYEYHFIKARYLKTQSKHIESSVENLYAVTLKFLSVLGITENENIIRNESLETISKLILYLEDQEL